MLQGRNVEICINGTLPSSGLRLPFGGLKNSAHGKVIFCCCNCSHNSWQRRSAKISQMALLLGPFLLVESTYKRTYNEKALVGAFSEHCEIFAKDRLQL